MDNNTLAFIFATLVALWFSYEIYKITNETEEIRTDDLILYYRLLKYGMNLKDEEEFKDYLKQVGFELKKNNGDK